MVAGKPFRWSKGLEIGVPEIDDDHRDLVKNCNLIEAAVDGRRKDLDIVIIVRHMQTDCIDHFRREEGILRAAAFPEIEPHVQEHRRFELALPTVIENLSAARAGSPEANELAFFFRSTLIDHFLYFDLMFKSHLLWRRGH